VPTAREQTAPLDALDAELVARAYENPIIDNTMPMDALRQIVSIGRILYELLKIIELQLLLDIFFVTAEQGKITNKYKQPSYDA
jgi:hypothetical protein